MSNPNHDPFHEVMNAAQHNLEGNFPGMPEMIEELSHQQLGRAIVQMPYTSGTQDTSGGQLVGYILPRDHGQTKHLVIFNSGHIFAIQSVDPTTHKEQAAFYKQHLTPNEAPYVVYGKNLAEVEDKFIGSSSLNHDKGAILSNTRPEHLAAIHASAVEALTVSRAQQEARDRAVAETAGRLIAEYSALLYPKRRAQEPGEQ